MHGKTKVDLKRLVIHKTSDQPHKQFIIEQLEKLENRDADIWLVLSCKFEVLIIFRLPQDKGAPRVKRWELVQGELVRGNSFKRGMHMKVMGGDVAWTPTKQHFSTRDRTKS